MKHRYTPRRASAKRWLDKAPPYVLDVLDSKGPGERYTVLFTGPLLSTNDRSDVRTYTNTIVPFLGMSDAPTHPQGVSMWGEMAAYDAAAYRYRCKHQRIRWINLPYLIREHVYYRVNEGEEGQPVPPELRAKCEYRDSNPKIRFYRADGTAWSQCTNHFKRCRDALAYFQAKYPLQALSSARIDHRND